MRYLLIFSLFVLLPAFSSAQVGKEILVNPNFSAGLEGWETGLSGEYRALDTPPPAVKAVPGGLAYCWVKVPHKAGPQYISIQQPVDLIKGKTYRVKGEVRLVGEGIIRLSISNVNTKRNVGFGASIECGATWQSFEYLCTVDKFEESDELKFNVGFAGSEGTPAVRNLSLTLTNEGPVKKGKGLVEASSEEAAASITAAELLAEFKADVTAAKAKYTEPVALNGPITNVGKGPSAGLYIFELEFGAVRVAGLGSDLGNEALGALATKLREGKARLAAMQKSSKWGSFSADEKKEHARSCFPTLHATASITGLKGNAIECGRSSGLVLDFE